MSDQYLTFDEIRQRCYDLVNDSDTDTATLLQEALDEEYQDVCRSHRWRELQRQIPSGLYAVGGSPYLFLPYDVGTIHGLYNLTGDQPVELQAGAITEWGYANDLDTPGEPSHAWHEGSWAQRIVIPASNRNLELVSTAAGDTIQIRLTMLVSGQPVTETVTLTGATPKAVTAVPDEGLSIISMDKVTHSDAVAGTISLRLVTGSTVVAQLVADQSGVRYVVVRLWPVPTGATEFALSYQVAPLQFSGNETVQIPVAGYLVYKACAAFWEKERKLNNAVYFETKAANRLRRLLHQRNGLEAGLRQAVPGGKSFSHFRRYGGAVIRGVDAS